MNKKLVQHNIQIEFTHKTFVDDELIEKIIPVSELLINKSKIAIKEAIIDVIYPDEDDTLVFDKLNIDLIVDGKLISGG